MVRPGIVYRVSVMVLQAPLPLTVRVAIQRNGVEISGESMDVKEGIPETIILRVSQKKSHSYCSNTIGKKDRK